MADFNIKGVIKTLKELAPDIGGLILVIMFFALIIGSVAYIIINQSGVTVPADYVSLANNTSNTGVTWFTYLVTGGGVALGFISIVVIIKLFGGWLKGDKGGKSKSNSGNQMTFG